VKRADLPIEGASIVATKLPSGLRWSGAAGCGAVASQARPRFFRQASIRCL
jgi:hypothetical protein